MQDLKNVAGLFNQINGLLRKNEELSRLKKESFNIFSLLRKEKDEEHLHSAFIAELLNPQGTHQMGGSFFRLFLKHAGLENSFAGEPDKEIAVKTEAVVTGGESRIDIHITSGRRAALMIENKIDAGDQNKQLYRYHSYMEAGNFARKHLLYLTLDGKAASEDSANGLKAGEGYLCVSYRETIAAWLKDCLKEAVDHPALRESIKQYLYLIKKLTRQVNNDEMEKELFGLISNNLEAGKFIVDNWEKIMAQQALRFTQSFYEELNARFGNDWTIKLDKPFQEQWSTLTMVHNSWKEGLGILIQGYSLFTVKARYGVGSGNGLSEDEVSAVKKAIWDNEHIKNMFGKGWFILSKDGNDLWNFGNKESLVEDTKKAALLEEALGKVKVLADICLGIFPKETKTP